MTDLNDLESWSVSNLRRDILQCLIIRCSRLGKWLLSAVQCLRSNHSIYKNFSRRNSPSAGSHSVPLTLQLSSLSTSRFGKEPIFVMSFQESPQPLRVSFFRLWGMPKLTG
ncbi:hypothetical protein Salat_1562000 [Sesamum alatum]|uniref:Uncharacterized protein n=1 Tax=Sesamum alatum TaxID=300844 RepID=A0AAE1YCV6_9LAMI|nr:hypothetical protein Salat_1562000 [Sesamum alatum]